MNTKRNINKLVYKINIFKNLILYIVLVILMLFCGMGFLAVSLENNQFYNIGKILCWLSFIFATGLFIIYFVLKKHVIYYYESQCLFPSLKGDFSDLEYSEHGYLDNTILDALHLNDENYRYDKIKCIISNQIKGKYNEVVFKQSKFLVKEEKQSTSLLTNERTQKTKILFNGYILEIPSNMVKSTLLLATKDLKNVQLPFKKLKFDDKYLNDNFIITSDNELEIKKVVSTDNFINKLQSVQEDIIKDEFFMFFKNNKLYFGINNNKYGIEKYLNKKINEIQINNLIMNYKNDIKKCIDLFYK